MSNQITSEELNRQIEAYAKEYPTYKSFAAALKRVLEKACEVSIPEVIVQARPKSVASFAEKCVRKFERYPDAVNQMTDLCGARVILPTLDHVRAVQMFVEHNFEWPERDDKTTLLGEGEFGYRDMHYLIRLKPDRAQAIGFVPSEIDVIGRRIAELQVRSVVQHAWADILHDRMYKAPLKLSSEAKRTGALLAAIMEDGDRSFNLMAGQLDGMFANFSAYVSREHVEKEIKVQALLLGNAAEDERPKAALRLARLTASEGAWQEVVKVLKPHRNEQGPLKPALLLELGHALCRLNRASPKSPDYREGQDLLQEVVDACEHPDLNAVPDLRRNRGFQSRALARLGWSWEPLEAEAHRARACYRKAVELEPGNPYYLADMIGFEIKFAVGADLVAGFRSSINSALATCRQHTATGTELPTAFFTAARLNMLLENYRFALNDYACGVRHILSREGCKTCDFLEDEIAWLHRVNPGKALPDAYLWAENVLQLGQPGSAAGGTAKPMAESIKRPVLIVAGAAASLQAQDVSVVESLLREALSTFQGTIVSGGTTSGVPGCVGKIAKELADARTENLHVIGYIPRSLPADAEKDKRYHELVVCGTDGFTPAQVLQCWQDLLAAGVKAADVLVLGFGGGEISAFEYRLALALGGTVGLVTGSGGSADALLKDPLWSAVPGLPLLPLPADAKTVRAFVVRDGYQFEPELLETMAREFHARYLAHNLQKIRPETLKPWGALPDTYKKANREQAAYSIRILEAGGFGVRPAKGTPTLFTDFKPEEVELMAQLEHGRWNIQRLRDGWRPGLRSDDKKLHNCIVAWTDKKELTEEIKGYDRTAVRAFPEILAKAGLEVFRK